MMYAGHLGNRFSQNDPGHLGEPLRARTPEEEQFMATFFTLQHTLRTFLTDLPNDVDGRARATALTKLDEVVQWGRLAIDK